MPLEIGLERALREPPKRLRRAERIGLLLNQASVDRRFRLAHDLFAEAFPGKLKALFGPQHGLWSTEQDNMVETGHTVDPRLGVPVHSLYSEIRSPDAAWLQDLDLLVIDLQDVGTRVYTYIWTITHCLEQCRALDLPVLLLDRPNPVGGEVVEGPLLDPGFTSFVGRHPIPMRHGLTMGELALHLNRDMGIGADLEVVRMQGWRRSHMGLWGEGHGAAADSAANGWVPPSPNLPRFEGCVVYPGQVLLEGTTLSEGRGTTTPFEVMGAPGVDPYRWLDALKGVDLPGITLRPVFFEPTFQKHSGTPCGGLFLHVTHPQAVRSYRGTAQLMAALKASHPDALQWRQPPYEYETEKLPIDILSGSPTLREAIDSGAEGPDLDRVCRVDAIGWMERTAEARRHP